MKKRCIARAAFLNPCLFLGSLIFFAGVLLALFAAAANPQVSIDGRARNLDAHVNSEDEAAATVVEHAAVQYVPVGQHARVVEARRQNGNEADGDEP